MVNQKDLYDPKIETMSKQSMQKIQITKFNSLLKRCKKSDIYSSTSLPSKIKSIADIQKLPFTTKDQLRKAYPYGSLCVDLKDVIEVHTSSGTTGNPVPIFLTRKDLDRSNEVLARTWFCNGIRKEDAFMMMGDYGLFTGGLLNHYALTHLGTFIIPMGASSTEKQLKFLKDFKATSMAGIASHYFRIIEKMKILGIKKEDLNLKVAIAAGEPYSEETRDYFEKELGCKFMDQYGLAEINTGLAGECKYRCGLHIPSDYVFAEVVSPEDGSVLKEGIDGELVLTTLDREANPVIRYRTGDLASISHDKCKCGRTTPRISRIKGRVDDLIFVKGIKLYPQAIESALWDLKHVIKPEVWMLKIERIAGLDTLTLSISPLQNKETAISAVKEHLTSVIGIKFNVNADKVLDSSHKVKRILDLRKEGN